MVDASVSAAGMRVVRLLVGSPPKTVADLIKATGVTRTAVTEQLNELVAAGFVERTTERLPGRGRPRHLYTATGAALVLLFASNQRLVVPAVWQAVGQIGGDSLVAQVLDRVGQILADHYQRRIDGHDPEQRLRQMCQILREEGVVVDVTAGEEEGSLAIHKRSCPFISMFDESRCVCRLDRDMMSRVVGRPMEQTASRHDGDACCSFRVWTNGYHDPS